MKIFLFFTLLALNANAYATVDSNTTVFIPVKHVQTGEFFIQLAPIVGCFGLPKGPQLLQLTQSYFVNNIGCGTVNQENINALICASILSSVEADDFSTFKKITLDISDCEEKNNIDFLRAIKKSVKLNFATKSVLNPQLILIKEGKKIDSELM